MLLLDDVVVDQTGPPSNGFEVDDRGVAVCGVVSPAGGMVQVSLRWVEVLDRRDLGRLVKLLAAPEMWLDPDRGVTSVRRWTVAALGECWGETRSTTQSGLGRLIAAGAIERVNGCLVVHAWTAEHRLTVLVPRWVTGVLNAAELALWVDLASRINTRAWSGGVGECWPSATILSESAGTHPGTIRRLLVRLDNAGTITRQTVAGSSDTILVHRLEPNERTTTTPPSRRLCTTTNKERCSTGTSRKNRAFGPRKNRASQTGDASHRTRVSTNPKSDPTNPQPAPASPAPARRGKRIEPPTNPTPVAAQLLDQVADLVLDTAWIDVITNARNSLSSNLVTAICELVDTAEDPSMVLAVALDHKPPPAVVTHPAGLIAARTRTAALNASQPSPFDLASPPTRPVGPPCGHCGYRNGHGMTLDDTGLAVRCFNRGASAHVERSMDPG